MNKTYINITITYYSNSILTPDIHYYRNDGINPPTSTFNKLTIDEANQLMWELVRLGGKNSFRSNPYRASISERQVTFFGQL